MKKISSTENTLIKYLISLQKSKNRDKYQQFLIAGWHLITEGLKINAVTKILIDEKHYEKFKTKISENVEIFLTSQQIIKKIAQTVSPQPIVALCNIVYDKTIDVNNILLIDDIQDPSNLGAILRSCSAFNIKKIYLSNNSVDVYNHKVISSSQGAIFKLQVNYCDLSTLLLELKNDGYFIFSTFLHEKNSATLDQIKFKTKNAFLFGNEGKGINFNLKPLVDQNFEIKTSQNVESLNLAISVAITLYCLFNSNIIK